MQNTSLKQAYSIQRRRIKNKNIEYFIAHNNNQKISWKKRNELTEIDERLTLLYEKNYFTKKLKKIKRNILNKKFNIYTKTNFLKMGKKHSYDDLDIKILKYQHKYEKYLLENKSFYVITSRIARHQFGFEFQKYIERKFEEDYLLYTKGYEIKIKTGLFYDINCLFHFGMEQEPECPERYETCIDNLTITKTKNRCIPILPSGNLKEILKTVHKDNLIYEIYEINEKIDRENSKGYNTTDDFSIYENIFTFDCISRSVKAAIKISELVYNNKLNNGFCLARPPGHHCTEDQRYGFCHANNIAIAATHLLKNNSNIKILIIDWDLHHGNGTQDIFYDNSNVVYISVHQELDENGYAMFPNSGYLTDIGGRDARGTIINMPIPIGCGDSEYLTIFDYIISPIISEFEPSLILVSAGFDSAMGDPLGLLELTPKMYGYMTRRLIKEQRYGKVVLFLEGGYNPEIVGDCVLECAYGLLGDELDYEPKSSTEFDFLYNYVDKFYFTYLKYWKNLSKMPFPSKKAIKPKSRVIYEKSHILYKYRAMHDIKSTKKKKTAKKRRIIDSNFEIRDRIYKQNNIFKIKNKEVITIDTSDDSTSQNGFVVKNNGNKEINPEIICIEID